MNDNTDYANIQFGPIPGEPEDHTGKPLKEQVTIVRQAILAALPINVKGAAITIALAEVIKMLEEHWEGER